jgi:hypothetical protein
VIRSAIILPFIIVLAASVARGTQTDTDSSALTGLPAGARTLALGGGTSALDTESTAVRANPAGLGRMRDTITVCLDGEIMELGARQLFFGAAGRVSPKWTIGYNTLWHLTGDDIEFRQTNTTQPDSRESAVSQQHAIAVAAGLFNALDIGFTGRYIRSTIGPVWGDGFSGDLGLLYAPYRRIMLSFVTKDIVGGVMHWSSGGHDSIGVSLKVGASLDLNPVILAGEIRGIKESFPRYSGGIEWEIIPEFTARAGMDRDRLSGGFGITIPYGRRGNVRWDYAFVQGAVKETGYEHRISLTCGYFVYGRDRKSLLFPTEEQVAPGQEASTERPGPIFRIPGLHSIIPRSDSGRGVARTRLTLAVAPLDGSEAPPGLASRLAEILRTEIAKQDYAVADLVTASSSSTMPVEPATAPAQCANAECAAEYGKKLGVMWVVAGRVEKGADGLKAFFLAVDPGKAKAKYEDQATGKTPEDLEAAVKIAALRIAVNIRR